MLILNLAEEEKKVCETRTRTTESEMCINQKNSKYEKISTFSSVRDCSEFRKLRRKEKSWLKFLIISQSIKNLFACLLDLKKTELSQTTSNIQEPPTRRHSRIRWFSASFLEQRTLPTTLERNGSKFSQVIWWDIRTQYLNTETDRIFILM